MHYKKEREFQYPPGIEKMIEDVIGGGTIDRASLRGAVFNGKPLDELPPLVVVVQNEDGVYCALKTAQVFEAAAEAATSIKVTKNHLFAVGDFVTVGGDLQGASDEIAAIDKSNAGYDVITLAATIGAAAKGMVLVQAKDKQGVGATTLPYDGEVVLTMNKVDLTVANQQSGLLVRGTVNESCMPFPIDKGIKALMPFIRFV